MIDNASRILLVADGGFETLADLLGREGWIVDGVRDADAATMAAHAARPDVALVEMRIGTGSGLAVMEAIHRLSPRIPVVLVSAQPTVPEAVCAMQAGADCYLPAGSGVELVRAIRRALERPWGRSNTDRGRRTGRLGPPTALVGGSAAMRSVLRQAVLVAPTRTTVLLLGETGTGKERLAQAIHEASPQRHGPFVAVNCAALAETLLDSELFGHEKGAFTGAHCRREGRFMAADAGTIFLDEIGEISPSMQVKLLRVLQERRFERVGGNETLSVDIRVIAATNRNLRLMVEERSFRADLFYRLNVMAIEVPPLRVRAEDIPALVEDILPRMALERGLVEPPIAAEALNALMRYEWPGNVRELENVLERAAVLAQGGLITAFDLPTGGVSTPTHAGGAACLPIDGPAVPGASFREIERHAIMTTYEACGRSPSRTAEILGISPRTVHYRLREYRGERGRRSKRTQAVETTNHG